MENNNSVWSGFATSAKELIKLNEFKPSANDICLLAANK